MQKWVILVTLDFVLPLQWENLSTETCIESKMWIHVFTNTHLKYIHINYSKTSDEGIHFVMLKFQYLLNTKTLKYICQRQGDSQIGTHLASLHHRFDCKYMSLWIMRMVNIVIHCITYIKHVLHGILDRKYIYDIL